MIQLIYDIRKKLDELEEKLMKTESKKLFPSCFVPIKAIEYVDLSSGTVKDKTERIVEQLQQYSINMLPTSEDSQFVRSAIVAELGEDGLKYWLSIRKMKDDFDEQTQIKRYNNLLRQRGKNTMNFGTVINRYRQAINLYNENNLQKNNN